MSCAYTSGSTLENYFSVDWRGCSLIGSADDGYVTAAADLHRFSGRKCLILNLHERTFKRWHEHLHNHFPPVRGGYAIENICRVIGESSRKIFRERVPAELRELFAPDTELDQWFAGSLVVELSQSPQMMFRVVPDGARPTADLPKEGAIWFAEDGAWATFMGQGGDLAEVLLSIKKPFELPSGLSLSELGSKDIPEGHDGLIMWGRDGRIEAAAVSSFEQVRFAGAANPDVEAWYASFRSDDPQAPGHAECGASPAFVDDLGSPEPSCI
jgi:hypothetical protein